MNTCLRYTPSTHYKQIFIHTYPPASLNSNISLLYLYFFILFNTGLSTFYYLFYIINAAYQSMGVRYIMYREKNI